MVKTKGLGRGLDALLGGDSDSGKELLTRIRLDKLRPGKYQPRSRMDEGSLQELAESIKAQGLMQPILARPVAGGGHEIIAGERRWRAAMLAGLTEAPVLVREVADEAALAMALIENIQRENLNPLEEAAGLARLVKEFGLSHQEAAHAVGRSRVAVSNLLRLLQLSKPVQGLVMDGALDMGHARALLPLDAARQYEIAQAAVRKGLSVREVERTVQKLMQPVAGKSKARKRVDRDIQRLQEELSDLLGAHVVLHAGKAGRGRLSIEYTSLEQLDDLLQRLGMNQQLS
jgi:ParB family transcriptional regulator, chromosome partitioning protein